MLCQACGKNTATTYIKTILNGELMEHHLCSPCAEKMGYNSIFGGISMGSLLGSFFGGQSPGGLPVQETAPRCEMCGSSFQDIVDGGKVGCADCYALFYENLTPTVQRIHGNTNHTGKIPASVGGKALLKNEIKGLKKQLKEAVAAQDFENAAVLRDQIQEKEKEVGENE